jgi:hypothetical protein
MAEMRPDNNHRQAVNKLLEDVRSNEELRIHLARDPEPVLQKYGLAKLVEQQGVRVTIDIGGGKEGGPQVAEIFGVHIDLGGGHLDAREHADISHPHGDSNPHSDSPAWHWDASHQDLTPHIDL